jgi:nucleotide-binding universal stress UspA family protein
MPSHARRGWMTGMTTTAKPDDDRPGVEPEPGLPEVSIARIAAAVDPHAEGRDAAALGAMLAEATGADLALVTIEPDLPLVIPGFDWQRVRGETTAMLSETQDALAPGARTIIDTDLSIPRGIERVVRRSQRDLLVVGSSPKAADGAVRIGRRTRQLLHELECPLVVAARGFSAQPRLRQIGVGFEGSEESRLALATAATIAAGCGAELTVRAVLDDRIPWLGWRDAYNVAYKDSWDELMEGEFESLKRICEPPVADLSCRARLDLRRGHPTRLLDELSDEVDLIVIGSRRWGPLTRVLLGGTGEALMHGARCSIMVVPRPRTDS